MKINGVDLYSRNINRNSDTRPIAFERRLKPEEEKDYHDNAIKAALDYLGVQSVAMILHGSCNPVTKYDLGVGSPCNEKSKEVIKFEQLHGFNANQLGPLGEITKGDISPYSATVFAINRMFIDPYLLTTDEYANILSKSELSSFCADYSDERSINTHSKYFDAFENYDKILKISYENFKDRLSEGDKNAVKLQSEYNDFIMNRKNTLLYFALFKVLSDKYGTRKVSVWENEIDRNLPSLVKSKDVNALKRYRQLMVQHSDDINSYVFGQFIVHKQMKDNKDYRKSIGFEYINDNLIGNDASEEWMYPDVFLTNYRLGCPEGGKDNNPQAWDIPVVNPKKLFDNNGNLGPAGKFLRDKLESALEYCENIRIDHALGLVDPYIYDKNSVVYVDDYHIDCSKFRGSNMSNREDIDPNHDYEKILEKIVLPVLKKHNITPEQAVWEDIGSTTDKFKQVYYNQLNIPGMTQLFWYRGENSPKNNWVLVGSHDEETAISYVNNDWFKDEIYRDGSPWQSAYLAGYLNQDPIRSAEKEAFQEKITNSPIEMVKAKYAEMFVSGKRIQIPFTDFFGINERYNEKGTKSYKNWKLRLNNNYQDMYYKYLESDNPTAINMPEILKMAVQAKIDMSVVKFINTNGNDNVELINNYRNELNKNAKPILDKLEYYEAVLKEKEN